MGDVAAAEGQTVEARRLARPQTSLDQDSHQNRRRESGEHAANRHGPEEVAAAPGSGGRRSGARSRERREALEVEGEIARRLEAVVWIFLQAVAEHPVQP